MNNKKTPAYLVVQNDHINAPVQTLFLQDDLLTARKAAMTLAEALFGAQVDYNEQDAVDVYLVEAAGPNDPSPVRIARVLGKSTTDSDTNANRCNEIMQELTKEHRYYEAHKLPTGFGSFVFSFCLDAQADQKTTAIVLFDAMGYAMCVAIHSGTADYHDLRFTYCDPDKTASAHLLD